MKELLIPAGNMECLKIAVHSGADAIYLGGKKFGARAYANNFTDEELVEAIQYAHIYGVKVHVTVNTMMHEDEIYDALEYLRFLYENGVDAVIVQDIGLISLARKYLPNLPIHASTQVHNTNADGIKLLEELGVERVVFARELSVEEIESIDTKLEKEAFIHGSLCVSYSGNCLFSSVLMNRSGNRGECAQICRLPFKLYRENDYIPTEGEYLLSPRDLNTSNNFKKILDSSIYSLKIEGRMKSPEYVGCVTKLYRDLLDKYYSNKELVPNPEYLDDLSVIFNRKYTEGFILGTSNQDYINDTTSNHQGVKLGEVIDADDKYITVKLERNIHQGDGIRFVSINEGMICNYIYDTKTNLINGAKIGDTILLDNRYNVKKGEVINITIDVSIRDKYLNPIKKRIPVDMKVIAKVNNRIVLNVSDGKNEVNVSYGAIVQANNRPVTKDDIILHLDRLNDTAYSINKIEVEMDDNIFINLRDINEVRRMAIEELNKKRILPSYEVVINDFDELQDEDILTPINITLLARNEDQIKAAIESKIDRIYVTDKYLYNKYSEEYNNIYFRCYRVKDSTNDKHSLCTELGSLYRNRTIGDYFLNVSNHATLDYLSNYSKLLTLSTELELNEVRDIMQYYNYHKNVELVIYNYPELMITKYCLLNKNVNKNDKCHVCMDKYKYYLMDRNKEKYRIITDYEIHLSHIMNYQAVDKIDDINEYKNMGVNNFRIELLDENYQDTLNIIRRVKDNL